MRAEPIILIPTLRMWLMHGLVLFGSHDRRIAMSLRTGANRVLRISFSYIQPAYTSDSVFSHLDISCKRSEQI